VRLADNFNRMPEGFDLGMAIAEADRCLLCHDAPCSKGCPADTKPAEFIRKFRLKNITGAIRTIKENNILGGACGVLCPTERLCEKECSAKLKSLGHPGDRDDPVRIGQIQRFLIEHSREMGFKVLKKGAPQKGRVAIVGSGPAGLSCAAELAKAGLKSVVFESKAEAGGMIRYGVVPFRFDLDFLDKELEDIRELGVEFKFNTRIEGKESVEKLLQDGFDAVFLATGLWSGTDLKPDEEKVEGLYDSIDYLSGLRDGRLEEIHKTIENKVVAVIGGGATAMDCVESAKKLGAKDVYLVYRRSFLQMPAEKPDRIQALEAGIHFLFLNQPIDYIVDAKKGIRGLKLVQTILGDPDTSGRRKPKEVIGSDWALETDVIIKAIGNKPEDQSPDWYPNIKINEKKLVVANPDTGMTSVKGIFAGGDIVRGPALVVTAVQDGKNAAKAIINYLGL
jgi:glutamate synthase (NADPH) small chain